MERELAKVMRHKPNEVATEASLGTVLKGIPVKDLIRLLGKNILVKDIILSWL